MNESRDDPQVGLCAECVHAKKILSDRGSVFYFCWRSESDPRFVKYPRLPVLECPGFEPTDFEPSPKR